MGDNTKMLFLVIVLALVTAMCFCAIFFMHTPEPSHAPFVLPVQEAPVIEPALPILELPPSAIEQPALPTPPVVAMPASAPAVPETPPAPSSQTVREELKKEIADTKKKLDEADKALDELEFGK